MNNYEKIIYLKYSELTLKKNNRPMFIRILVNNIFFALKGFKFDLKKYHDYLIIENFDDNDLDSINEILKKIPGLQYITVAYKTNKCIDDIKNVILQNIEYINKFNTFKVNAKRTDKNFHLNSLEISRELGGFVLKQLHDQISVSVNKPELQINIEIKDKCGLVFFDKIECSKGLPVGSGNRILVLLSGGIDSPVASSLLMHRGMEVLFLSFITPPHTCENSLEKIKKLVLKITNDFKLSPNSKLLICNYTSCMHELTHISKEAYRITLMRRSFVRIATKIATKYGCSAIATGDSLGQVASQTIESLSVINQAANSFLILRPLIGIDKNTIIDYAKKFETYSISIEDFPDSCSLFAPKNPTTRPNLETCVKLEQELELLNNIEESIIENKIEEWVG